MLHKIIIINSELHAKATIELSNAASIQLVGQNNIGKSSLINTLNFLYITEPSQMRFEGGRRLSESLPHYFPSLDQSYIIFEIKNSTYSCILVKRTKDNDIAYYHIPHAYDESFFFTTHQDTQQVIPFDKIRQTFLTKQNIQLKPLNRNERYRTVYSTQKAEEPVLLLAKAQNKGRRHLNTFASIYKHLIRSTKPSADELTNMLIAASGTDARDLNIFARSSNTHLEDLEKRDRKIKTLTKIKPTFDKLKEAHQAYQHLQQTLGKDYHTFLQLYNTTLQNLNTKRKSIEENIQKQKEEHNKVREQQAILQLEKGKCIEIQKAQKHHLAELQQQLQTIAPYESKLALSALQTEVDNLEAQKIRLKKALYDHNQQPRTTQQLKKDLAQHNSNIQQLAHTINNYADTLTQHISPDINVRKRLNTLLSQDVLTLPKTAIKKQVTKITQELTLFDGKIDTSNITTETPFTSIEELHQQRTHAQQQAQAIEALLTNQQALKDITAQWQQRHDLLRAVQAKPTLIAKQQQAQQNLKEANTKEQQLDQQRQIHEKTAQTITQTLDRYQEQHQNYIATKQRYETWKDELRQANIDIIEAKQPATDLDKLYQRIIHHKEKRHQQQQTTTKILHEIQSIFNRYHQPDIDPYIKRLQEEIDTMENCSKARDKALESIINVFVNPTQTFLGAYHEFKSYLHNFSRKLAGHHISGIEKIDLHLEEVTKYLKELTEISDIKRTTPLGLKDNQQDTRIEILKKHIAAERIFKLKDFFKLKLKLTKKGGKTQTLDIGKQMESYGTDKVLRIFIFLMLLKEFFVPKPDNRVAIYIDEVGTIDKENIQRILNLCAQYHALPIFASVELKEGFDKYYTLLSSMENNGKIVLEKETTINVAYTTPQAS